MASDWDVVVVGGCNFDYLVRGAKLPTPGETSEGDEFQEAPGGKGANQAIAAARLGARVAFVARVGSDSRGDRCLQQLTGEGVDVASIVRDPQKPTGVALILVDASGRKQIMTAPGANRAFSKQDLAPLRDRFAHAKVVLSQLEIPVESVLELFRMAREAGAQCVLDPAPAASLPNELLELVDVIRPNATEAEVLTGIRVTDRRTAKDAAQQLMSRGVKAAIVQAGDEGDLAVWKGGEQWLPKLPVQSIDATGAGDAFAAALAVQLAAGISLAKASLFANAASALATTQLGAQAGLPRRKAVEDLLSQHSRTKPD